MKHRPSFSTLFAAFALTSCLVHPPALRAENEIGFIERFALASDREKALGYSEIGSDNAFWWQR